MTSTDIARPTYQLYLGDCLEFMRTMDAGSVDAVVTDPPYDEKTHNGAVTEREKTVQGGAGETVNTIDFDHMINHNSISSEFIRVSKSWSIVFCTFEDMGIWRDCANEFGEWIRAGVWDRVNPAPQFTGDRPSQACDGIAIMHKGNTKKRWNGGGHSAIWRASVEFNMKQHPTQKPLKLMRALICDFSNPGDTIFDPFMGSGTTGMACMQLGRNFIGCEIDPKYYAIAEKRIREASLQPPLFTDAENTQKIEQAALL